MVTVEEYIEMYKLFSELLYQKTKNIKNHPNYSITSSNFDYLVDSTKYLVRVEKWIWKLMLYPAELEKTRSFLINIPTKRQFEKLSLSKTEYLRYHLEVYLHKIFTFRELMVLTANEVYELGLSSTECSWNRLEKELKKRTLGKCIMNYHKSFGQTIQVRHSNTHRAEYRDIERELIESDISLSRVIEALGEEKDLWLKAMTHEYYLENRYKRLFNERIELVNSSIEAVKYYKMEFIYFAHHEAISRFLQKVNEGENEDDQKNKG